MVKKTKILCGLITLSTVFGHYVVGQAAENINEPISVEQTTLDKTVAPEVKIEKVSDDKSKVKSKDKKKNAKNQKATEETKAPLPPAPVTIEGDDVSFDNQTGDVYAKGNVIIKQNPATLYADDIRGNTQRTEVQIDGKAKITQPGINLDGYSTFYNYQAHTGNMSEAKGIVDYEKHVKGERIEFLPDEYIIYNGTVTKCPAKKPDYYMRAKKIEIWPNDRMIAYDAQFLVKGKVIYSTSRYETEIGTNKKQDNSPFPRVGYGNDTGVYVIQNFQAPISDSVTAEANIGYYSKDDFKSDYRITKRDPNYTLALKTGDFLDDDDHWIKKEPELQFTYAQKRIAGGPWKYDFDAIYGKWDDDEKTSWHQDYTLYFSRDPVKLSRSLSLSLGTGYEIVKESYDGSQINTMKYDATFNKRVNNRISVYTGYHYTKNNNQNSLFDYDNSSVGQELSSGISYRFDAKNALSIRQSYDLSNGSLADMYYTWDHSLHCWNMALTYHKDYQSKDDSIKVKLTVAHW